MTGRDRSDTDDKPLACSCTAAWSGCGTWRKGWSVNVTVDDSGLGGGNNSVLAQALNGQWWRSRGVTWYGNAEETKDG